MIIIYTRSRSLFSKEFWKWVVRRVTKKYSGPNAVEDSLLRGLKTLGVPFKRNVRPSQGDTSIVLSGVSALREAIQYKKSGYTSKLIAGPNIAIHPYNHRQILLSPEIDTVLVPSKWTADFWKHEAPEISKKVTVWASGTPICPASTRDGAPILYDKIGDGSLRKSILEIIGKAHIFRYGAFKRDEYLDALKVAPYAIHLTESESQGLALQEAWSHDVPTLVNKNTHWGFNNYSWDSPQINCPYLTGELGKIFKDYKDIAILIPELTKLHPKEYCDKYLSDRASAKRLLDIIESIS